RQRSARAGRAPGEGAPPGMAAARRGDRAGASRPRRRAAAQRFDRDPERRRRRARRRRTVVGAPGHRDRRPRRLAQKPRTTMTLTITRSFQFCAGHRLHRPDWSDEKNREIFGLCSNPAGHGHNYELEVSVTGPLDGETGMIMNLRELKELVRERVIGEVDHKNLNVDVPWMRGVIPTTEQ